MKRCTDLAGSLVGLAAGAPLLAGLALLVLLVDGRPVFFVQPRVGLGGRRFPLLKLRTMRRPGAAETRMETGEPEATRLGTLLRRFRLDELPQLFNVLAGQMSLVGPRPEQPHLAESYAVTIPRFEERLSMRPGLTGLAQVSLPPGEGEEYARLKLEYDLQYASRASPLLDAAILLRTIPAIWRHRTI